MKILIVRNDKLGDFMLAFPAIRQLKLADPAIHVTVLIPEYTREMAEACEDIDEIMIDPGQSAGLKKQLGLLKQIRAKQFDAAITLFSTTRIGGLLFLARIPYRLAPATKLAQVFYNHRLTQRRSRSEKPEWEYNLDLARYFLQQHQLSWDSEPGAPFLHFENAAIQQLKEQFYQSHSLATEQPLIFIHAGSGGSANNLSIEQYAQLCLSLARRNNAVIVLTAGPGEQNKAAVLGDFLANAQLPYVLFYSTNGLLNFARHIAFADLFIAGSTGPLHIAGALNIPTVGFYTRRRSATPLRWQTLNTENRRLAFTPPDSADEMDLGKISINEVVDTISQKFFPG